MRSLRGAWGVLAFAALLSLPEVAVDGGLTLSYKYLVDGAFARHDARLLLLILSAVGAGVLLAAALSLARDRYYARWSARTSAALRQAVFDGALAGAGRSRPSLPPSEVLSRFSTDLAAFEAWLAGAVSGLLVPALNVLMGVALLFLLADWRLALLTALAWPATLLAPRWIAPRAAREIAEVKRGQAALLERLEEPLAAGRVVEAYGLERYARERFRRVLEPYSRGLARGNFLGVMVERSTVLTVYAVQAAIVSVTAALAFEGRLSVGAFVAFAGVYWNLGWSVVVATRSAPALLSARASLDRVEALLQEQPKAQAPKLGRLKPLREKVALEEVHFGYGDGPAVLAGVSLEIPRGAYAALVGPSGSGKSSILSLLAAFHAPRSGRVLFDGADLAGVEPASLRKRLGFVFQDSVLLDATLADNIRLGRLEASDAEVHKAARLAELQDLAASLPGGYDTRIDRGGAELSGGQRQRVAVARALIREPELLLLDEATSALDPATEAALDETLRRGAKGRTTVSVTHRLAQAARADVIFVVQAGRVVERGRHEDLLALGGLYAELWRKQDGLSLSPDGSAARVSAARLARIPLLAPLSDGQRAALADRFVSVRAAAGQPVVREGEPGDLFYVLARGRVTVSRRGPAGATDLGTLVEGDEFGELALLRDAPRNATVTAKTDCLLLGLPRQPFLELLRGSPEVRKLVMTAAAKRV